MKYKLLICIEKCFTPAFILLRDAGKSVKRQLCLSHLHTWWRLWTPYKAYSWALIIRDMSSCAEEVYNNSQIWTTILYTKSFRCFWHFTIINRMSFQVILKTIPKDKIEMIFMHFIEAICFWNYTTLYFLGNQSNYQVQATLCTYKISSGFFFSF